jgi:hypothetical protein
MRMAGRAGPFTRGDTLMTVTRPAFDIVAAVRSCRDYFAQFSKLEPMFLQELAVSEEVLGLLTAGIDGGTRQRVQDLVERPLNDHYDGSVWHYFKSVIAWWLKNTADPDA